MKRSLLKHRSLLWLGCLCLLGGLVAPVTAVAGSLPRVSYPEMETLNYKLGPIRVAPGDNEIYNRFAIPKPSRPGYITRFEPNLVRVSDGSVPATSRLHVHHAAWSINGRPSFSAGGEKNAIQLPRGFGIKLSGLDQWGLVYMLHNQVSSPEQVYLTWKMDFVPLSPGLGMKSAVIEWLDVSAGQLYGVFDAPRGSGSGGRLTYPSQDPQERLGKVGERQDWVAPRDLTLIGTAGHIHPGGLFTTLWVERRGERKRLFRSRAKYFNSRLPITYDMAMTATRPDWRVKVNKGDRLYIDATIDTSTYSWREQMGVMPIAVAEGHGVGGVDPFVVQPPQGGILSHGSLPENRSLGGYPTRLPDPRYRPDGPRVSSPISIRNFRYQLGDLSSSGLTARPPVIAPGQRLTFINQEPRRLKGESSAYHTVTACRAPCTATSGNAYPLAGGRSDFDSGQLGIGRFDRPPAKGELAWSTPRGLNPGTYSFFCRVHPSMRGAFRVKADADDGALTTGWQPLPEPGV